MSFKDVTCILIYRARSGEFVFFPLGCGERNMGTLEMLCVCRQAGVLGGRWASSPGPGRVVGMEAALSVPQRCTYRAVGILEPA